MMLTVPVAAIYLLLNVLILLILIVAVLVTVMMLLSTAVRLINNCLEFTLLHTSDINRIWNSNPFPGMIRLQGGAYSNEGRVEVYCNGQWGTICSTGFGTTDANTICKQLGYDNYYRYNHLSMLVYLMIILKFNLQYFSSSSISNQPIWSTNMYSTSSDRCFGTKNTCPSSSVTTCSHSNDVTISCSKSIITK